MGEVILDWAGEPRVFRLNFGNILDLEQACGRVGIGEIYLKLGTHNYFANYVYHTIRQGLLGGGMRAEEADKLLQERFMHAPMVANFELAL